MFPPADPPPTLQHLWNQLSRGQRTSAVALHFNKILLWPFIFIIKHKSQDTWVHSVPREPKATVKPAGRPRGAPWRNISAVSRPGDTRDCGEKDFLFLFTKLRQICNQCPAHRNGSFARIYFYFKPSGPAALRSKPSAALLLSIHTYGVPVLAGMEGQDAVWLHGTGGLNALCVSPAFVLYSDVAFLYLMA